MQRVHSIADKNMPLMPRLYLLLLLCLCWIPLPVLALDNITLLVGTPSLPSNEFVEQFKTEIAQGNDSKPAVNVIRVEELVNKHAALSDNTIIIAVGVQALYQASKLDNRLPVLGVLVSQPAFDKLQQDSKRNTRNFSAIVLDQPIPRQIALIKALMPSATHIGILLGPLSRPLGSVLQQAASQQGFGLLQENIRDPDDLVPMLKHVLSSSPVLLAVPDPIVYNRETVQTILLTSYRYQKPVIGFSQAYVRAGALAAVFSTPGQVAKQAAEVVRQFAGKPQGGLPPPLIPKYFSVETNRQVARSLGIELGDENALSETLLRIERPLP